MPKKRIPGYRLHKPSGNAVVTLNGRDFYLGRHKSKESWTKYNELIGKYIADDFKLSPPTRSSKDEITIQDAVVLFLEYAQGYYLKNGEPTSTLSNYQESLTHIVRWYGNSPVSDFGPLALQFIRNKMMEEGYGGQKQVGLVNPLPVFGSSAKP